MKPEAALKKRALIYPQAHEDHPWGHTVVKVRNKIFVMLGTNETGFVVTLKLPISRYFALDYPGTKPTGYGLGKSGWITATFPPTNPVPMEILTAWLDESYRAVAPKKLVVQLPTPPAST
jgi:predicted DNA-binding protein (MmcQ/YjbR family)